MSASSFAKESLQVRAGSAQPCNPLPFIFLYGPPGSGKSALAPRLARKLGLPWLDLDDEIERRDGRAIYQIFAGSGEEYFRHVEDDMLRQMLAGQPAVIALGGGALLNPQSRRAAEAQGKVICLSAQTEVLMKRVRQGAERRPLLATLEGRGDSEAEIRKRLDTLLEQRQEHYRSFSIQLDTTHGEPGKLVEQMQTLLGYFYLHNRINHGHHGCPILIQNEGLAKLGALIKALSLDGPIAVVADANVANIYGKKALESLHSSGLAAFLVSFRAGEEHKTAVTVNQLYRDFAAYGLDRHATVVALGGGVTTDLAGYAASTYMRGVKWVAVPTTLLGMADASIGGKTGYDLPQGKNLVGTFYQPALVLADPQTLATLPRRELIAGMAEMVKAGLIADPGLFQAGAMGFEMVNKHLEEIIRRSIAVKVRIVRADAYELGRRAALNLGHTLGHAVERASGYRLLHGEAVAIGTVLEARLAEHLGIAQAGLADRIAVCLEGLGLPTEIPHGLAHEAIRQAVMADKKRIGSSIRFTLPIRPGRVRVGVEVEDWAKYILDGSKSA